MKHTVDIADVTKSYGPVQAVRQASFRLSPGTVALVGHNGAGKTTLMKLMLGLIRPSSGTVRVLGENPSSGAFEARRRVGYLPENVAFNAALTGRETLAFYARLKGEPVDRALRLLDRVGLASAGTRRVGTYSKGMRQRLGLAQALLGTPEVLLLDEPTTGLDPAFRLSFYDILAELTRGGSTVLLSSHALSELEDRAGRVIIMDRGRMVADGSLDELRRIAQLPTRFRVRAGAGPLRLPPGLGPVRQCEGGVAEFDVHESRKMETLRALACADAPPEELDMFPPSLDALYAHFLRQQDDAR